MFPSDFEEKERERERERDNERKRERERIEANERWNTTAKTEDSLSSCKERERHWIKKHLTVRETWNTLVGSSR